MAAQIQDGNVQEPCARQVEHVQNPPDAPVAVREGVDEGHFDQRVERAVFVLVHKTLQRGHVIGHGPCFLRRHVDDLPRAVMGQRRAGCRTKTAIVAFEQLEHGDQRAIGDQPALLAQAIMAQLESISVARHLLCLGRAGPFGKHLRTEQIVLGGHDVFDLAARLGLLQRQRVDQNALGRDPVRMAL